MSPWTCIIIIFLAGGLGGLANAFLSGEGVPLPHWRDGIWCPGFIGNAFVGAMAALVSWGLYGSGSGVELALETAQTPRTEVSLTIGACAGAMLVGVGGAKWLSNEIDKKFLRETVSEAGKRHLSQQECEKIKQSPPERALAYVRRRPESRNPT